MGPSILQENNKLSCYGFRIYCVEVARQVVLLLSLGTVV